jgi:formylglycine-generating enzyme required for sulfatase activity
MPGVLISVDGQRLGYTEEGRAMEIDNVRVGQRRILAELGAAKREYPIEVRAHDKSFVVIDIEIAQDGATMVPIPAGEFWMGSSQAEIDRLVEECRKEGRQEKNCRELYSDQQPRHRILLDAYYVDQHEVTNQQFERFVRERNYQTEAEKRGFSLVWIDTPNGVQPLENIKGATWRTPNPLSGLLPLPSHPVVQISWADADAYCKWAGKRLLTEAEWEAAARGREARRYPWGDTWVPENVNGEGRGRGPMPVGHPHGRSPYDVYDMAGNVWEWVADHYDKDYYQRTPSKNPTGPSGPAKLKVLRGGSWVDTPNTLTSAYRHSADPKMASNTIGFRCGRAK